MSIHGNSSFFLDLHTFPVLSESESERRIIIEYPEFQDSMRVGPRLWRLYATKDGITKFTNDVPPCKSKLGTPRNAETKP